MIPSSTSIVIVCCCPDQQTDRSNHDIRLGHDAALVAFGSEVVGGLVLVSAMDFWPLRSLRGGG